jgi:hypothetical protein
VQSDHRNNLKDNAWNYPSSQCTYHARSMRSTRRCIEESYNQSYDNPSAAG